MCVLVFLILKSDGLHAGAAFAHSNHMEETWIALLEKAFAKYHGSYAALEQGFTHFALEELTGGEADAISIGMYSKRRERASRNGSTVAIVIVF